MRPGVGGPTCSDPQSDDGELGRRRGRSARWPMTGSRPVAFLSSTIYDMRDLRGAVRFWLERGGRRGVDERVQRHGQAGRRQCLRSLLRVDSAGRLLHPAHRREKGQHVLRHGWRFRDTAGVPRGVRGVPGPSCSATSSSINSCANTRTLSRRKSACSTPALRSTSTSAISIPPPSVWLLLITDLVNRDENHPMAVRVNCLPIYTHAGTLPLARRPTNRLSASGRVGPTCANGAT